MESMRRTSWRICSHCTWHGAGDLRMCMPFFMSIRHGKGRLRWKSRATFGQLGVAEWRWRWRPELGIFLASFAEHVAKQGSLTERVVQCDVGVRDIVEPATGHARLNGLAILCSH